MLHVGVLRWLANRAGRHVWLGCKNHTQACAVLQLMHKPRRCDYVTVRVALFSRCPSQLLHAENLGPIAQLAAQPVLLAVAAHFPARDRGTVRLIDNTVLTAPGAPQLA